MEWIWRIIIITLILAVVAGLAVLILDPNTPTPIEVTVDQDPMARQVGVYGAVRTPGVYEYEGNIRVENAVELAGGLAENADSQNAGLARWVDDGETVIIPTLGSPQATLTPAVNAADKIDLNTADKAELMTLPGIGEKRADDIIHLREQKGRFSSPDELLEITGIGEKMLESIYDLIIVQ